MIRELKITNLALIESLHLTFSGGLTVLTGETGAGKSIVLQAINLLAGGKASGSLVRTGAEYAAVEALFEIAPDRIGILDDIKQKGFEIDDSLIVKRVLSNQGRSRYYINGGMATARQVGDISENLLSVASQHDHQQLLDPRRHIDFIDTVGDLWPKRMEFSALFSRWQDLKNQLRYLTRQENEKEQRRDFLSYQCNEIRAADIKPDEDELLAKEKTRLKASDTLIQLGLRSYETMIEAVNQALAQVRKDLEQMATLDQGMTELAGQVSDVYYHLEDQAVLLREYCDAIPNDSGRLEIIEARLDLLQRLKRKYGGASGTVEEVLNFARKAEQELDLLDDMEQKLGSLTKEIDLIEQQLLKKASELSILRRKVVHWLTKTVREEIRSLHFEQAEFEVRFGQVEQNLQDLDESGWDRPKFMFSANPGEPTKPLIHVASGGELSRLMLGLKCILAQRDRVETVIFDEVDTGIGGRAAEAVARKIKELSGHHQVLCITHLPQIASYADEHFMVSKSISNQRTHTFISRLPQDLRADELARMLAGDSVTEQTLAYVRELMNKKQQTSPRK